MNFTSSFMRVAASARDKFRGSRPLPTSLLAMAALLTAAGFTDVRIDPVESPFVFPGDGTAAAERVLSAGPLGGAFLAADEDRRRDVVAGVVEALEHHRTAEGFEVPAASWCVTAWRPPVVG